MLSLNRDQLNHVIDLVNDQIADQGYECLEAEWLYDEGQTLRLFVDRVKADPNDKGVDLQDCVRINELLMDLDELDAMIPDAYNLEVSSPGVERPLRLKSHFEGCIGQTIQVKLGEKVLDRVFGKGRLVSVSDDGKITIDTSRGAWSFPIGSLETASVVYNWNKSN